MKITKSSLLILIVIQGIALAAQDQKYILDTTSYGDPMIFGQVTSETFMQEPFNEWFIKNTNEYEIDPLDLSGKVKKSISRYNITVYMGTWCGDSRKEVPRMIKVLKALDFDMSRVKIQALDQYKQAKDRGELGLNIHRVPTIIFSKNGREKGRIVEHPISSIAQDINQIITSNKYQSNYYGLQVLHLTIAKKGFDVLNNDKLIDQLKALIKEDYELYKYGAIYFRNKEYDQAFAIYDFNAKLFPISDRPYQSKGVSYFKMGDLEKAKANLEKALRLNPENKRTQKYLELINEKENIATK